MTRCALLLFCSVLQARMADTADTIDHTNQGESRGTIRCSAFSAATDLRWTGTVRLKSTTIIYFMYPLNGCIFQARRQDCERIQHQCGRCTTSSSRSSWCLQSFVDFQLAPNCVGLRGANTMIAKEGVHLAHKKGTPGGLFNP